MVSSACAGWEARRQDLGSQLVDGRLSCALVRETPVTPQSAEHGKHETIVVLPEDALRAQAYRLFSRLFAAPADAALLATLANLRGDQSPLGRSIDALARLARGLPLAQVQQEYQDLLVGLGRGELVPYGSYYQTGFMNEKPLARLRRDMARLGLAREADVREPEDHIAILLETMAGLIDGCFCAPASLVSQRRFFDAHIGSWAGHFLADLERAQNSVFYAAVGTAGRAFLDVETAQFAMVPPADLDATADNPGGAP